MTPHLRRRLLMMHFTIHQRVTILLSLAVCNLALAQQPPSGSRPAIDPKDPPAPYSNPPEHYSFVSGAGKPWTHGYMKGIGYRSGREGVMYSGPTEAKPGWLPFGSRAGGTAVERGLIPPITPLLDLHVRDTSMTLGGDGNYYMTGSTGDNIWDQAAGVELWRSPDLKDWEYLGLVWTFERASSPWMQRWGYTRDLPTRAVWAPEIHYLPQASNYFIAISFSTGAGCGLLMSTTGKPEGPYESPFNPDLRLSGGIDGTLFEDDDGKVYFTRNRGDLIFEIKSDFSGFAGAGHRIEFEKPADGSWTADEPTYEGAHLFKHNGRYYLGGAAFYEPPEGGHRYSSVLAVADQIYGPYKLWHEAVPCGGGGNYFKDKEGRWWVTVFGNDDEAPFREMPAIIRVEFAGNGRVVVSKDQPFVDHADWNGPLGLAAKVASERGGGAAFSITTATRQGKPQAD